MEGGPKGRIAGEEFQKDAEFQKERKGRRVRERGLDRNVGQGLAIKLDSYGSWQSQNSHALDKAGRCGGRCEG